MNITTLIPAYKTNYIVDLLNSLRLQTVKPQRIVISDDSPQGAFREVFFSAPYAGLRAGLPIDFIEGPRNGAYENVKRLVGGVGGGGNGEGLVHVMLDDDLIYPTFYERHVSAHASGDFSCSVSRRWSTSETGQPTAAQPVPAAIAATPHRMLALNDEILFLTAVGPCSNWLGEFSNAVFRADCIDLLQAPTLGGVSYAGLWDLGAFVAASLRRPVCHLQDHLGGFRVGPNQNSSNLLGAIMKAAHLAYLAIAIGGHRAGRCGDAPVRQCAALLRSALAARYAGEADMAVFAELLPQLADTDDAQARQRFVDAWHAFQATHGF